MAGLRGQGEGIFVSENMNYGSLQLRRWYFWGNLEGRIKRFFSTL